MPTVELTLPRLFNLQRAIADHPATRKVVCAGRRSGKTTLAAYMAVDALLRGRRVLLSSTSQDQADVFWDYLKNWLRPLVGTPTFYRNEVKRLVRFGRGSVRVKTGRHPDVLRGIGVDLLVLDECAYLDGDTWHKVGAPLLADTNGTAVFISTPNRRNWFFELYQRAASGGDPRWAAWHFSTLDNPHLPAAALAALTRDMSEVDYQQEILARFVEHAGAVFRRVDAVCRAPRAAPYAGRFVAGLDWAQTSDFTAIAVIDVDRRVMVDLERFHGLDWALQRGRVRAVCDRWHVLEIVAEANAVGGPNVEALQREGLPVRPFVTTSVSKPPLIESLALAFDRDELVALDDPILKGELLAFERTVTAAGRSQYSAPPGLHDDCVIALALAWHAAVQPGALTLRPAPVALRDYRGG